MQSILHARRGEGRADEDFSFEVEFVARPAFCAAAFA